MSFPLCWECQDPAVSRSRKSVSREPSCLLEHWVPTDSHPRGNSKFAAGQRRIFRSTWVLSSWLVGWLVGRNLGDDAHPERGVTADGRPEGGGRVCQAAPFVSAWMEVFSSELSSCLDSLLGSGLLMVL